MFYINLNVAGHWAAYKYIMFNCVTSSCDKILSILFHLFNQGIDT